MKFSQIRQPAIALFGTTICQAQAIIFMAKLECGTTCQVINRRFRITLQALNHVFIFDRETYTKKESYKNI